MIDTRIDTYTSTGAMASRKPDQKAKTGSTQQLTDEQKQEVARLRQADQHVRNHELAHMAAGAGLTGAPSYSYTVGPDGKRYATGGEVGIDSSAERDPDATIRKMARVKAAALAPADPSGQDLAVAASADATAAAARMEKAREQAKGGNVDILV
jgi:hypothetical protein